MVRAHLGDRSTPAVSPRPSADRSVRRSPVAVAALTVAAAVLAAAWGLASCASGSAVPSDPTLAKGQEVYLANCASCHGGTGGGGAGPRLIGVADRLTEEQQVAKITDGVSGTAMPAWGERLSAEEIEAVAAYTRSLQPSS